VGDLELNLGVAMAKERRVLRPHSLNERRGPVDADLIHLLEVLFAL
jgi:hypothetical protein